MAGLREATDADSEGVIALITGVFAEYPGCVMDVDGEEPHLRAPASSFDRFWVIEDDEGRIVACIGCSIDRDIVELKKLYVAARARRRGYGRRLAGLVEDTARGVGASSIELWSDTRFTTAHELYLALGYTQLPGTRDLHDKSNTTERHFVMRL